MADAISPFSFRDYSKGLQMESFIWNGKIKINYISVLCFNAARFARNLFARIHNLLQKWQLPFSLH